MINQKLISEALQQMTGFQVGKWSDSSELVSSMGLREEEWEHIKENEESGHLDDDDIKEINQYFANSGGEEKWKGLNIFLQQFLIRLEWL